MSKTSKSNCYPESIVPLVVIFVIYKTKSEQIYCVIISQQIPSIWMTRTFVVWSSCACC